MRADLGGGFLDDYKQLVEKAAKYGLNQEELNDLLEKNRQTIKAMDDFEKTLEDKK